MLCRLAQAEDLRIEVKASAKLKEGQSAEQLNNGLKELSIGGPFKKE